MEKYLWDISIYEHVLMMQGGGCHICGSDHKLVVDHDHSTGETRGILCNDCNLMIGYAKDNLTTLQNGIEYLSQYAGSIRNGSEGDYVTTRGNIPTR